MVATSTIFPHHFNYPMKIPALFKEYIWLVETIDRAGRISFAELNKQWMKREESGGMPFSRTTFNRHRDAIQDVFGVEIECDRTDGFRYYILNKEVLEEDSVQNWMFSTLSVSNLLDENLGLHNRILLEGVSAGDVHLQEIINAMRENRRIAIAYRKYGATEAKRYDVAPYCVKLFRRRWYMLAMRQAAHHQENKEGEELSVFALDRIEQVELQKKKFTISSKFDAARFFDDCFGIVIGDGSKPISIVLRAYGQEPYYLRSLPLHHSQREINSTEEYTDFELFLRPTNDFKAHILSRGEYLQVLSPHWLAEDVRERLQAAAKRYN